MPTPAESLLEKYGTAIDLEFVRGPSGMVHIIQPEKPSWARTEDEERIFERWSEAVEVTTAGSPMVCGLKRFVSRLGVGKWDPLGVFLDEDLCSRCVRGLGSQSARAFEHPQPGDKDGNDE